MKMSKPGLGLVLVTALAGCGGGGGTQTAAVNNDPPVQTPATTEVAPLAATVAESGLTVQSSAALAGGGVTVQLDQDFGITITTTTGGIIRFDQVSDAPFFRVFGGYSSLDETDITVIALPGFDAESSLTYATYGYWAESDDPGLVDGDTSALQGGAFFGGNNTPISQMPTTGAATYLGFAAGNDSEIAATELGLGEGLVVGTSTLDADFAAGTISGILNLNNAEAIPYTDVSLLETRISANTFEGIATSTLGHNGTMRGQFFGPAADEVAGLAELNGPSILQIAFGAAQ